MNLKLGVMTAILSPELKRQRQETEFQASLDDTRRLKKQATAAKRRGFTSARTSI